MKSVRMGAGLGFYRNSWRSARAAIEGGSIQTNTSDHLAQRMEIEAPADLPGLAR